MHLPISSTAVAAGLSRGGLSLVGGLRVAGPGHRLVGFSRVAGPGNSVGGQILVFGVLLVSVESTQLFRNMSRECLEDLQYAHETVLRGQFGSRACNRVMDSWSPARKWVPAKPCSFVPVVLRRIPRDDVTPSQLGVTAQHLMSATLSGPRHKRSLRFLLRPRSTSSPRFGWWLPVVVTSVWRGRGPPGSPSPLGPPVSFQTQAHIASTSVPVCLTTTLTPLFFRIQAVLSTSLPVPSFNASALQCDPSLPARSSTLVTTHLLLDVWKVGFLVLGAFGRHSIP
ncbi:uncharacterized protein LACBIDRAFT_331211 [Laccaria bicolor S238N-H82]|uniref:Predicted protein n=1 Tax=Laccaria bicolor (strain S238N-H82 / ATCC MYA-4686) TaxID=486041 RepID=B0DNT5_LACBS|nr:uncharacterized protein LACBIDRAFT_331211 [Laccaria bicolor S238N-H82]EDR03709.1 predicted protein [Laccaria bicolor S238N-H82]|eukprot:XP_001885562.1 predicted protein [Laccaria bicolor S238N-H82]